MTKTPASLLERLRRPGEAAAWDRFVELYTPLIYSSARKAGLQESDAADLVQEVFLVLVATLPTFTYDRKSSFRAWLRTVTMNKWRDRVKRRQLLNGKNLELAGPDSLEAFWEAEYRQCLTARALEILRRDFQQTTWQAFWEHVALGRPAPEVAADLGLTAGAVYAAKFRVLDRLRQELGGMLE